MACFAESIHNCILMDACTRGPPLHEKAAILNLVLRRFLFQCHSDWQKCPQPHRIVYWTKSLTRMMRASLVPTQSPPAWHLPSSNWKTVLKMYFTPRYSKSYSWVSGYHNVMSWVLYLRMALQTGENNKHKKCEQHPIVLALDDLRHTAPCLNSLSHQHNMRHWPYIHKYHFILDCPVPWI